MTPEPDYTTLRIVVILCTIAFLLIVTFGAHWMDCYRLAPIERAFVPGC